MVSLQPTYDIDVYGTSLCSRSGVVPEVKVILTLLSVSVSAHASAHWSERGMSTSVRLAELFQEGTGSVRFVSVPDFSKINRFGSVRFGNYFPGSTRFGLRFSDASWLGPVRFGSVPRPVPAGSGIKRFGSVRFGRFGSVSYSFLLFRWQREVNRGPGAPPGILKPGDVLQQARSMYYASTQVRQSPSPLVP